MNTSHNFNQRRKRLEPVDKTCRFCSKAHSERMEDNYFVPVFKEQDRTTLVVYNSVKFSKIEVGLSRCKNCQSIHENSSIMAYLISIGLVAAIGLIIYLLHGIYVVFFLVFGIAIGVVLLPIWITSMLVKRKNILTKKEGAKREPLVGQMLREGWTLTQPSA